MFLEGTEYQTIWKVAHQWANANPDETEPENLPEAVKELMQRVILGFMRGDLVLRTKKRLPISMKEESLLIEIFVVIPVMLKLRKCLIGDISNKALLDSYYVQRGELLRWCEKEFLSPPSFWSPKELANSQHPPVVDESDTDGWYESLTERRKQIVTSLEIAKRLWEINPIQGYEEVHKHPDLARYGYPKLFSLNSFKNWTRPFASDYAKNGGRPKESNK